jgi:integrase
LKYVEPIRDKVLLSQILEWLKKKNIRDYLMFLIGINTGLRVSDILKLRYKDLNKDIIYITEKKTNKLKEIPVNSVLRDEIRKMNPEYKEQYIFKSRQGNEPITIQRAWQIMKEVEKEFKLKNLGTHTMRKTFGYHFYQKKKDVVTLMEIFQHASDKITLRYIGVNRNMVNEAYKDFNLK